MKKLFLITILFFISSIYAQTIHIKSKELVNNSWHLMFEKPDECIVNKTTLSDVQNNELNHTTSISPSSEIETASIFLIDASISMKNAFVSGIKTSIKDIFDTKRPWDHWAIASFDAGLKVLGDFNQSTPDNALQQMQPKGKTTELYRSVLEAIKLLSKRDEKNRFLLLFSDGEYEDQAYTFNDVIQKAKEADITILSFGYKDSTYLQNIRRIAEETGGKLWKAKKYTNQLPSGYIPEVLSYINNRVKIRFDATILPSNKRGEQNITLKIFCDHNKTYDTNLSFPVQKIIPQDSNNSLSSPTTTSSSSNTLYITIGLLLLLTLISLLFLKRKSEKEETDVEDSSIIETPKEPIAYFQNSAGAKIYIYNLHTTIGALEDNDIILEGDYISRHHAILDYKDGNYFLIDHNSTNGTLINGERISHQKIKDGDILNIGPLELTFHIITRNTDEH